MVRKWDILQKNVRQNKTFSEKYLVFYEYVSLYIHTYLSRNQPIFLNGTIPEGKEREREGEQERDFCYM